MIYLITGVPGSGKTLYAVSSLVQKLAAEKITDKSGIESSRRLVVDGIPNLLLPHEMMARHDDDKDGLPVRGVGDGVWNWHDWCKPGDVIVIDEVQRHWRPRGMGTKPAPEIKMLETHRHKGVDFVIITQNPMLIDQNVRRLVGRHQHVRRLFGMARAAIYDWDGCSVDVQRVKSATMSIWNYPKSAYELYKSSELHTKQRQKIPAWLIIPALAVVGGIFVGPMAFDVLKGSMTGKGVSLREPSSKVNQSDSHNQVSAVNGQPVSPTQSLPASSPVDSAKNYAENMKIRENGWLHTAPIYDALTQVKTVPLPAACIESKSKPCRCYTQNATPYETTQEICKTIVAGGVFLPFIEPDISKREEPKPLVSALPPPELSTLKKDSPARAGSAA